MRNLKLNDLLRIASDYRWFRKLTLREQGCVIHVIVKAAMAGDIDALRYCLLLNYQPNAMH